MTSIDAPARPQPPSWRCEGLRYYGLGHYLRRTFGDRVWKVSVDGGFGCPNVDGPLGAGGCVFCNVRSFSPSRRLATASIRGQIDQGAGRLRLRGRAEKFIAYFQPGTNTYGPIERLRAAYEEAMGCEGVVGLAVGTRPDCVPDQVLDLLAELGRRTWLSLELGLQTIHEGSLTWMRRRHDYAAFVDAVERSHARGLRVGAHVILGLPGETRDQMLATARELARLRIESVKIHNLHAVKDTPLAAAVARGEVRLPDRDEYVGWVVEFLQQLAPQCVIDRLSGDAPAEYLVGPDWCRDKGAVRAAIEAELRRRDTWQGRCCEQESPR